MIKILMKSEDKISIFDMINESNFVSYYLSKTLIDFRLLKFNSITSSFQSILKSSE